MFDHSDQFHQFIASRASLPIPISPYPVHVHPSFSTGFDPYHHASLQNQELPHQDESLNNKILTEKKQKLVGENEKMMNSWSSDEVILLLKLRSSMENWFPDFSWEHVSRKLAEHGFNRSAEQCKEKFEEQNLEGVSYNNKSYRVLTELDEFCRGAANQEERNSIDQEMGKQNKEADGEKANNLEEKSKKAAIPCQELSEEVVKKPMKGNKKRKRKEKFEMLKGFCEAIVSKMMAQQEEMHKKLIEEMVKRDEENIAREEAWKNQEMDRARLEIEKMEKEQASAGQRQDMIIEFLKKFTSEKGQNLGKEIDELVRANCSISSLCCDGTESTLLPNSMPPAGNSLKKLGCIRKSSGQTNEIQQNPSSLPLNDDTDDPKTPLSQNANFISAGNDPSRASSSSNPTPFASSDYNDKKGDLGMRWPRDQVLALINLRCKLGNGDDASNKGPLWERISKGMFELGYQRSAKRCKEKWENINKYFRKTKDSNKKRSVDSRTCPYFHQLSQLYNDGTLVAPSNES